jgi:hypothetical protein
VEYSGSVEHVFEWVTVNGPAPNIEPRFARIEIIETIAVVHLEVQRWSGKLAGANSRASDVFTLLKLKEPGRSRTSYFTGTTRRLHIVLARVIGTELQPRRQPDHVSEYRRVWPLRIRAAAR